MLALKMRSAFWFVLVVVPFSLLVFLAADHFWPLPSVENRGHATTVVSRDGTPLRVFADRDGVWRFKTRLEEISPLYLQALIHYEDRYFYLHPGINPFSVLRAFTQNLRNADIVSGASTLTMQVARLMDPHGRSLAGKLKQLFRALQLEWYLSKTQILELYLELAPFGGNVQGVEAASRAYFGKAPVELSHAEAALLAVLPQAPSRYRPDRHPERAARARDKLVSRLVKQGIWSVQIQQEVKQEHVYARAPSAPILAPILARRLHNTFPAKTRIHTSINYDLQLAVQTRLRDYAHGLAKGMTASAVVVENEGWLVRAYVGTALFADASTQGYVDMVSASRSPGSTLKPFIYGMALDESLIHSQSLLIDAPRWQSAYQPTNFSGEFSGAVSAGSALRQSLNIPAVQVLEKLTPQLFNNRLLNAGIHPKIPAGSANLSMALGGFGISMEELLNLYGALGRQGKVAKLRFSEQQALEQRPLLSPQSAWIIHSMLAHQEPDIDVSEPPKNALAHKTGTSYGYRDAWAFGVSQKYTIGVWVGRPDGTPSPGQYGAVTALPLLFQLSDWLGDSKLPPTPAMISRETICWPSGLRLADSDTRFCDVQKTALGIDGQFPATMGASTGDTWAGNQIIVQVARDTGLRVYPSCGLASIDQSLNVWPLAAEPWLKRKWSRKSIIPQIDPRCDKQPAVIDREFAILSIKDGAHIRNLNPTSTFSLPLVTLGGEGENTWYLDGNKLLQPDRGNSSDVWLTPGLHELLAINESGASDKIGFTVEQW